MSVRDAFRAQAKSCRALGSPFTGRLLALAAARLTDKTRVGRRILTWPGDARTNADSLPLRFAAALHALRLQNLAFDAIYPPADMPDAALWAGIETALTDHADHILSWLDRAPQTNEVRRSAAIIPVLHFLHMRFGLPIALFELGASAGLNLRADKYRLVAGGRYFGPPDAAVTLAPDWRGARPARAEPQIISRQGVDLNPLDPALPDHRLRLLAYIWPDQADRLDRTGAAIDIACQTPAQIDSDDAARWLQSVLRAPRPGVARLVFNTVAWQYFPPATQAAARAEIRRAGTHATEHAPLAWLAMEADGGTGAALTLTLWPGGQTIRLGRADFHGRWVDWHGPDGVA